MSHRPEDEGVAPPAVTDEELVELQGAGDSEEAASLRRMQAEGEPQDQ